MFIYLFINMASISEANFLAIREKFFFYKNLSIHITSHLSLSLSLS